MKHLQFYSKYKTARDKAWQILLDCKIKKLPVDIRELSQKLDIKIYTYKKAMALIEALKLKEFTENEGFCTKINGHYVIFLDAEIKPKQRLYFTTAHEIGHIVLGHLDTENVSCKSGISVWNSGEIQPPNQIEAQANIFASRLLAPACVLKEMKIDNICEIMEVTGLSFTASKIRLERLNELKSRGKFYLSPQEARLKQEFSDFISEYCYRKTK